MSLVQTGDVVLVPFPFTDLAGEKLRPAVVISRNEVHKNEEDYTLLFISSVIPQKIEDYELFFPMNHPDFKHSGLKKDSLLKANKIVTVQRKLLKRKLGTLGPGIRKELQQTLQKAIDLGA